MEYFEDFESGQSLAALGWTDVDSIANTAGAGYNLSYGLSNTTSAAGEAQIGLNPTNPRMCLTFSFMRDGSDSYVTYFVAQYGGFRSGDVIGDMQIGFAIDSDDTTFLLDTSDDGTIDTVANFWPAADSVWRRCRIESQASTYTAGGVKNNDGIVRIWITDETGELTLRYNRDDLPIPDFRQVAFDALAMPWSGLFFTAIGSFDNIYCTDSLCAMQPPPPGGECCGTSGPGGGDPERDFDEGEDGPRVVPPGGYPPSYVACTGDGTPATASNPSDVQDLTDAVTPLVHLQLTLPDATVLRYGDYPLNYTSGNGQTVTPRALRWQPVSQTLADHYGSFEAMRTSILLSDTDGVIRGHLSNATNRNIDGREAILYIESKANAALSVDPRVLARGVVTNWRTTKNMDVQLEVMDPLGYRYSSVSLDRPLPQRVFRLEIFPSCPEHTVGRPVPIIYGEMSDDYVWNINPARIPAGIVPVYYVGRADTIPGLGLPENHWHAFVVCGHAIRNVQSWFASNDHEGGPASVRMDPGTAGVDFLIPGYSGWDARFANDYIDITGTDGVVERFTMVFARGPRGDAAADGTVPLTLNICGLEDVGDASGEVITDMAYQLQHFICYWVLQNYKTGTWGAVPTFPGGTAKVRTTSFDTVHTTHNARVTGGYIGSWYVAVNQKPAREWVMEAQVGQDIRLGVNHQGQIVAVTLDDNASTVGLTSYTAASHLEESEFSVDPRMDEIINVRSFEYGFEPGTGFTSGVMRTLRDTQSVTDHGERIAQPYIFMTTHVGAVATDIINRALGRYAQPMPVVRFKVDLRGLLLTVGQLVMLTHYAGIGSTGWTSRVVMVTKITVDPNVEELLCSVEAEDIHDLLSAEFMALDSGALGTATIG